MALQMEGIQVKREVFLREVLGKYCNEDKVNLAIQRTPVDAEILNIIIDLIADHVIQEEAEKVAKGSLVTGCLGTVGVVGELAQFLGFSLRVIQKLVYLYGGDEFTLNAEVEDRFTCFLGIMFGINIKITEFKSFAKYALTPRIEQQLCQQVLYAPIIKQVTYQMGKKLTKKGLYKLIPLGGIYLSSKLNAGYFLYRAEELQKFLQELS